MILMDFIQPGFKDYLEPICKVAGIARIVLADNSYLIISSDLFLIGGHKTLFGDSPGAAGRIFQVGRFCSIPNPESGCFEVGIETTFIISIALLD